MSPNSSAHSCQHCAAHSAPSPIVETLHAVDPVCNMKVDPASPRGGQSIYEGKTYSFCNPKCKAKFDAEPERYLSPHGASGHGEHAHHATSKTSVTTDSHAIHTCPMHPEVQQEGPGSCPLCGMALEPLVPTAEEGENSELVDMTRRFWMSALLTLPLLFLAMSDLVPGMPVQHAMGTRLLG